MKSVCQISSNSDWLELFFGRKDFQVVYATARCRPTNCDTWTIINMWLWYVTKSSSSMHSIHLSTTGFFDSFQINLTLVFLCEWCFSGYILFLCFWLANRYEFIQIIKKIQWILRISTCVLNINCEFCGWNMHIRTRAHLLSW